MLKKLKEVGLDEIRFNIAARNYDIKPLYLAKKYIKRIVIETPVIPEDKSKIISILSKLDKLGIYSMTLHEFMYFGHNTKEYKKRGYMIKSPNFEPFYFKPDVNILGSEEAIYDILKYAIQRNIKTPLHYCSFDLQHLFQHRSLLYYDMKKKLQPQLTLDRTGLTYSLLISNLDKVSALRDMIKSDITNYSIYNQFIELHMDYLPYLNLEKYDVILCAKCRGEIVDIGRLASNL